MASAETILAGLAKEQFGLILGIGIGSALAAALEPQIVAIRQTEYAGDPLVAPDAILLAAGVAQGQVDLEQAQEWAKKHGFNTDAFAAMVDIANVGPALGQAYAAWRRDKLTDEQFRTALRRLGIEGEWYDALEALKEDRLDLGAIATAIHRGIIPGQGLIVTEPPTGAGRVPQVPISTIDPVAEAASHGIDPERLRVMVGNTGLPPGLIEMLHLLNMGEVEVSDVQRAVAQSNLRNEYMDVVLALKRRLLTPNVYEEAALRGVISRAEADDGAALSGMEKADAELLFETMGRPLAVHQITTGLARGAKLGGTYDDVPEPYRDAIRRSNIRPEYAGLAYANRYTYPSVFVMRILTEAGTWSAAKAEERLLGLGWIPEDAKEAATAWAGGTGTKADPYVKKAQTQLWGTLHKSYVDEKTDQAKARATLAVLGVAADAQGDVLALWDTERELVRTPLTAVQIRKAFTEAVVNPATGAAWTEAEALAALAALGMSDADARTLLAE